MSDVRVVLCEFCGSEGRLYMGMYDDERDVGECWVCEGKGSVVIEVEPIEMEDLDCCPSCGVSICPMLFPCLEQGCPSAKRG